MTDGIAQPAKQEHSQELVKRQALLLEVTRGIVSASDNETTLADFVFQKLHEPLGADVFLNYRMAPTGEGLELVAAHGVPGAIQEAFRKVALGQTLCGAVASTGAPIIADKERLAQDERGVVLRSSNARTYACYPLWSRDGRILGTLAIASTKQGSFSPSDLALLQTLCDLIALAWERLAAQSALRASQERFQAAARATNDAIWDLDLVTNTLWWGDGVETLFGYARSDVDDTIDWWYDHLHPDDRDRVAREVRAVLDGGGAFWRDEYRFRRADGSDAMVFDRGYVFRDHAGRATRVIGAMQDVSERKAAEQRLRDAIAVRDEFLSVASHELRTPLTTLILQIERIKGLAARSTDGERLRMVKNLESAGRQAERLDTLVEGLVTVSKMAAGRQELSVQPFDLRELLAEVLERIAGAAERAHSEIHLEEGEPIVGSWDRHGIDEVVTNLLCNAIKYGAGQPIALRLQADDDDVRLIVRDEGIGIADEAQSRIFGRFERAVSSSNYGGLGLGLYIARQIVEAHGGDISVQSAPGEGATFTVRLPRVPQPRAGVVVRERKERAPA